MKVLAINGSPRMGTSNTSLILTPFLEGMSECGAEVELFYTGKLGIGPCRECFHCWFTTPGRCVQKDDMQMLLPRLLAADVWVLATPVFVDGMTGPMKNILDRLVPSSEPVFELRDGHCRHGLRPGRNERGKVVLVSNCGFWEKGNFDPLLAHVRAACDNFGREFAGAVLRPHGGALRPMMEAGAPVDDVIEAAREAGRQLVRDGAMSPHTLSTVSRELLPLEKYVKGSNKALRRSEQRPGDEAH